jgi:hypothetical protein
MASSAAQFSGPQAVDGPTNKESLFPFHDAPGGTPPLKCVAWKVKLGAASPPTSPLRQGEHWRTESNDADAGFVPSFGRPSNRRMRIRAWIFWTDCRRLSKN